ncbi:MAG TPA: serine/threonine protein kinase, partial [Candidatus Hydrogenedentes bacterium]|nr:serine/threonine protein kinase [Candidatus Hydrogenedentota bacterium]
MENNAAPERLGRYEIIRELGKGAMGVVYEGRDPSLGRRVAIKTARRDIIERSGLAKEMMERFLREARAAGMLNHPNIITIYDVGEEEGVAYIAMEFLEGKDLNTIITEQRKFDVETVANYGALICEALACAHDQGVFHRDVKPANIFIPSQGVLKVVDFGIARTHDSTLTQDGALIGTPTYMSPEQFMGQKVDARSDLFSVGIILYEMLTGEKPFTGEALTTIMHHILKSNPAPPHELNYLVPEALSAAVMRALSKRPQERYSNGRAMAAALR